MLLLGYFLTVLNYICYCSSRFMKTKQLMLLFDLIAKILTIAALFCLGSFSGMYLFGVSMLTIIGANLKERYQKKWTLLFAIFQGLYIFILFAVFEGVPTILVFLTSTITLICNWWLKPQQMRIVGAWNSFLFLAYQISIKNWAGLLEILVILSNFSAYLKYKRLLKQRKQRRPKTTEA